MIGCRMMIRACGNGLAVVAFLHGPARIQEERRWAIPYTGRRQRGRAGAYQVPGYYRVMIGDFEVTALYDGFLGIGTPIYQQYSSKTVAELEDMIDAEFRPRLEDGSVNTSVTGYLVNTGRNLILLDAGTGNVFDDNLGRLPDSMRAAGYDPLQVDIIIPTHMHYDHFSGVTLNGQRVFPNAMIYLAEEGKTFWVDTPVEDIPEGSRKYVQWARDAIRPYLEHDQVRYYRFGDEIIPGMRSRPTPGHTPGHNGIEFTSGGQTMLVWGDLMHNHAFQLADPSIAAEFDVNPEAARESRIRAFPDIARRRIWVAGAHLPFPGIGHIRANENGSYSWIPVEYTPLDAKLGRTE